jgi:hypothetical protein
MEGKRARPLMRGVAALALAMSLAVAGGCGASTTAEKASAAKDKSPGRSTKAANSTAVASGSGSREGMPQGSEPVKLDPADFTVSIDNPYWPMSTGTTWVYSETDTKGTNQKVVVEVTDETKMIANGIEARVVRDTVTENGAPVEITDDWYAQDKAGNIWYLGEATTAYEKGKPVSTEGSFEAGVDGAQAGVIMPARLRVGQHYRQEYLEGQAEDRASTFSLNERAEVPFRYFPKALMIREENPLEPRNLEYKFYARGVGPVLAVSVSGGSDREELVSYHRGR